MPSIYGEKIHVSIFGQSHSAAIGVVIDGLPAGVKIDMAELGRFMARRAPGQGKYATARKEADLPEFVSGVVDDACVQTRVRSNHWVEAVIAASWLSAITWRLSEHMRSERMGLRLYAIAEEPT